MSGPSKNYVNRNWFRKKQPESNPNLIASVCNIKDNAKFGYYGFRLYFPDENNEDLDKLKKYVQNFQHFFASNKLQYPDIDQNFFNMDYFSLISPDGPINELEDLKSELENNTEFCLNCLGLAMHQNLMEENVIKQENGEPIKQIEKIVARLMNYEPVQLIKDIRVNYYGKLVSVRGTVINVQTAKLTCSSMASSCSICTGIQIIQQLEGCYTPPKNCPTKGCKARSYFQPLLSSDHSYTGCCQTIKIQELFGGDENEHGRIPRTLQCELTEELVNSCSPGTDITITGVVKAYTMDNHKAKQNTMFISYLDAISIVNNKENSQESYGASERISFNEEDYYIIEKIHAEPQLFRYLTNSLCPNIYGHELVKAGLLLALFGGTKRSNSRAESHILMVGDPGLGKSQMLHACTNVTPRGVYVCGNTSTTSGLTATMVREQGGEYTLEAGALMLADGGCCCIDEFDKMATQHACLLEAMEQQSVSIAKACTVRNLPTRCTILAAANPAGGHYNKAKTIAENLKMSSPMLSRFDLIFILLDQPNEELDKFLSRHVLALHAGKAVSCNLNTTLSKIHTNDSLKERLKPEVGEEMELLSHNLFQKYIAYAQKYVNPELSQQAKDILKAYYLSLRQQFKTGDSTPVTPRQLNSLIRLTQARAKLELRDEATESDALEVIEIMKESLIDIFTNNVGVLDTTRSTNGTGMSTKKQVMKLLQLMQREAENNTESIFTTEQIRELSENVGIPRQKFFTVLNTLNIQGFILMKGSNLYQLITADL